MTTPHGSTSLEVVSLRLGRKRTRHPEIIRKAVRQTNELVQELSRTLGPFVRLNITGPHLTYGSVTFFIVRSVIDGEGKVVFEPREASITYEGGLPRKCYVTGEPNPEGKIPILFSSAGATQAALADPEDLGPPLDPVRIKD